MPLLDLDYALVSALVAGGDYSCLRVMAVYDRSVTYVVRRLTEAQSFPWFCLLRFYFFLRSDRRRAWSRPISLHPCLRRVSDRGHADSYTGTVTSCVMAERHPHPSHPEAAIRTRPILITAPIKSEDKTTHQIPISSPSTPTRPLLHPPKSILINVPAIRASLVLRPSPSRLEASSKSPTRLEETQ